MASLISRGKRTWRIQVMIDGARRSITFKGTKKDAQDLLVRIERLEGYARRGLRPSADVLDWIRDLDQDFRLKLVELGLLELGRVGGSIDDLLAYARELYSHLEPRTRTNYDQYEKSLREFFGSSRPIASVTRGDADELRRWLARPGRVDESRGYGQASVAKRIKYARQIFEIAVRKEWLSANPFAGLKVPVKVDAGKRFFVPRAVAD
ncbi:MAG: hypothetical protein E6Q97_08660 [Desulfurellales bacterium]|nr:MAG: hypothetical protein E6Q97_08660 [Desulfurellales bacterium]